MPADRTRGDIRKPIARRMPSRPICRRASPPASTRCRRRRAITRRASRTIPATRSILSLAFFYATTSGDIEAAGKYADPDRGANARRARGAPGAGGDRLQAQELCRRAQELVALGQGAVPGLTVSLFDGWAAAASGDAAGAMADMKRLAAQSGAEGLAAFHTRSDRRLSRPAGGRRRLQEGAGRQPRQPARDPGLWPLSGAQPAAPRTRTRSTRNSRAKAAVAPIAKDGLARIAANKKPEPFVRNAEDGVAEGLFGMAASLNDRAQRRYLDPLSAHGALSAARPGAGADLLLADRFEALGKYEDAVAIYRPIDKSSPYYRMAATQAARRRIPARQERRGDRATCKTLAHGLSQRQRELDRAGRRLSRPEQFRRRDRRPMTMPRSRSARRRSATGRSSMPAPWRRSRPSTGTRPRPTSTRR